jgi:transketolase
MKYAKLLEILKSELKKGIKVEEEHENLYEYFEKEFKKLDKDMPISKEDFYKMIAQTHIAEISNYYTKLAEMEK